MARSRRRALALALALSACGGAPAADPTTAPRVVSVLPPAFSRNAALDTTITIRFDRPVVSSSLAPRGFTAFGRWSGAHPGELRLTDGGRVLTLVPRRSFQAGDQVTVSLTGFRGADGALRAGGFHFRFWTRSGPAALAFEPTGLLSTRFPGGPPTRTYGGVASDMDGDGFPDLVTVNEDSADVRVFLNRADRSGLFHDFGPPAPVGPRASPSEPADFNQDGHVDLCVANIDGHTVSILMGRGDGSFAPAQNVAVGRTPRGIAVLDADGDGDTDIVNTNSGSSNLSLLLNDGQGRFGPPVFFDGGGDAEWALASEDMNGDGILDLVVGAQGSREVVVMAGRGDGTFTRVSATPAGGEVWQLATGDLDGDGAADVATANGRANNAAILLGDGRGGLRRTQTLSVGRFSLASDLADLDGDGDLDWIVSNFESGWTVLLGDGRGGFTPGSSTAAPVAGSCALALDSDGDGDLDLALIDEEADQIVLLRNR